MRTRTLIHTHTYIYAHMLHIFLLALWLFLQACGSHAWNLIPLTGTYPLCEQISRPKDTRAHRHTHTHTHTRMSVFMHTLLKVASNKRAPFELCARWSACCILLCFHASFSVAETRLEAVRQRTRVSRYGILQCCQYYFVKYIKWNCTPSVVHMRSVQGCTVMRMRSNALKDDTQFVAF